ncbi:MAG: hypothetical protein M0006_08620 [Magnetospirillum sp.]|nr:hypothetical protein [Magnetospirillum sp.]
MLTPQHYDQAEDEAAIHLSNRLIMVFQPELFQHGGFPSRVDRIEALWRFADTMHDGRWESTFREMLMGGLTDEEFELMREIARVAANLTGKHYARRIVPTDSLARAMNVFRHIRYIHPDPNATIFEVGPGSGYLGALLALAGYRYVSTDVTQALYLYQSHLMSELLPGRMIELATDPRSMADFDSLEPGTALHVPWWKWASPHPDFRLKANLVTANHCLCELHDWALAYTLKVSANMLSADPEGAFLFEGWGSTALHPMWAVSKEFADNGFGIAHNDILACVYVRGDGGGMANGLRFPLHRALLNPPAPPTPEELYHPPIWVTPFNPVSARIIQGRVQSMQNVRHSASTCLGALKAESGMDDLQSDDDKFAKFVSRIP